MTDIAGRCVLITGAASGIGKMLAEEVAALGGRLVLWDIDEAGLAALSQTLAAGGTEVHTFRCDLAQSHEIEAVAAATLAACERVDVLINNAGIVAGAELLDLTDEKIERTFAINTLAPMRSTRAFLPAMLERDTGHIVTIASAGGLVGTAKLTDYCASKFAAVGFDESLRMELAARGSRVRTTVVCPFYIDTGMFQGVRTRFSWLLPIITPEYAVRRILGAIAKNRQRLLMPRLVYTSFFARLLPVRWFDALMHFLGVSRSMEEFVGRRP